MRSLLKRLVALGCVSLALGITARGQSAAQTSAKPAVAAGAATPSADQILDRYLNAIGGRAAWEKLHSRTSLGRIDIPSQNLSGTIMIHEKAPNRTLLVIVLSGATFRQAYDGTVAWTDDPKDGTRDLKDVELTEAARDADFYHPLDLKKLYSKFAVTGTEEINGHKCYVVEGTPPEGSADKLYFDAGSGLLQRFVSQRHINGSVSNVEEDFDDYRDVDGVKLPFELQQTNESAPFTIHIDEMHHNVELDDSEFARPAAQ